MLADWLMLAGGLLLTLGTGVFVASEFSLVNLDRADLEAREARGERMLSPTIGALKHTSTHLSSAQLGITLTTLLTGYLMEPAIGHLLEPAIELVGLPDAVAAVVSSIIAIIIATLLSMILGELAPKNFALAAPLGTAKLVVPIQVVFTMVFRPAVALLNNTANGLLRLVGIEPKEELSGARTAEELSSLVRRSAMEGLLERDTATLLARTLSFSELTAQDVMTPRPRIAAIDRSDSATDLIDLARRTGFSRFPVIDQRLDDVVGVAHLKQAVAVPRDRRADVPVGALASDPLRVPETMPVDALLAELRPDELADRAGVQVPDDGPYDTVAGWMMSELGRIPAVGDTVGIEAGEFRVERMDGRRVDRIRFTPTPDPRGGAEGDAPASRDPSAGRVSARSDRQEER